MLEVLCICKFVFVIYTLMLYRKNGEYLFRRIARYVFALGLLKIKHFLSVVQTPDTSSK